MSELDIYLLVALFCAICGFFIGMGQEFMRTDHEPSDSSQPGPTSGARIAFPFTSLVGIGYLIAWVWVSHQPIIKLIPVFILAALASRFGAGLASDRAGVWLPVAGIIMMPTAFHTVRYLDLL